MTTELTDAQIGAIWNGLDGIEIQNHAERFGVDTQFALGIVFARALIAALPQQAAAPAGWKLVPIEPTDEMRFATTHINNSLDSADVIAMLRYAIAAAPLPPVPEGE